MGQGRRVEPLFDVDKIIAARKAGAKAFYKGQNDTPHEWFTTEGEKRAFVLGWWMGEFTQYQIKILKSGHNLLHTR